MTEPTPAKTATVTCDKCHAPFVIRNEAQQTTEGELQYFVCPHCNHRYEYAFVTTEGLRLRDQLAGIRRQRQQHDSPKLRRLHDKVLAAYQAEVRPAAATR